MAQLKASLTQRFPALTSRDFAIFWVGQFFSLIGTMMQNTAQPYLAYRLSNSALDLGLIAAATTLPTFFIALPGGVLVERMDKRKTVIVLQAVMMIQAFILSALTLMGMVQVWHIVVLALLLGAASTIETTARQAMLIELVGRDALPNAITLQSAIFNTARVLGPSLTAPFLVLIQGRGEGWAFLANGISYLFVIFGLFFVRTQYKAEEAVEIHDFRTDLSESWKYIRGNTEVMLIIITAGLLGTFAYPLLQQIPVMATNLLKQIADTETDIATRTSALYTAQGIGALISAAYLAANSMYRKKGLLLVVGEYAFLVAMLGIAFPRTLWPAFILIAVMGWGSVTQMANMNILIQVQVPNSLRGRVFSAYLWALQGVAPLGSLLIGWMVETWEIPITALVCGGFLILCFTLMHLRFPGILRSEG